VPDPVTEALGLSPLNFAGQWDSPYLLNMSGAALAQELGELTNVSLVLTAAAEANRLRKRFARDLEAAQARRAALLEQAQEFAGLPARRKAVQMAEEAFARLQGASAAHARLTALASRLRAAERAAADARAEMARQEPPSLARLEELSGRLGWLQDLARRLQASEEEAARFSAAAERAAAEEKSAHDAVHDALKALGTCPTCGSIVS
jgi:hypothetical protein